MNKADKILKATALLSVVLFFSTSEVFSQSEIAATNESDTIDDVFNNTATPGYPNTGKYLQIGEAAEPENKPYLPVYDEDLSGMSFTGFIVHLYKKFRVAGICRKVNRKLNKERNGFFTDYKDSDIENPYYLCQQ